jgi:tRNA threonylcarbamoyladenosine biosynthesis protein TsaB
LDESRVPDLVLAIETSNPTAHAGAAGVAVARRTAEGFEVLAEEPINEGPRLDDDLVPAIDRAMRRAGAAPADLGTVAISVGPGGYTSIRVGVSAGCMIARATGARVCAVPTAIAGAMLASDRVAPGTVLALCLAWKGDTVWRHRFRAGTPPSELGAGALVRVDAIDASETIVADAVFRARAEAEPGLAGAPMLPLRLSARAVARVSRGREQIDAALAGPVYPREPEAVTKWRTLHPGGESRSPRTE